MMPIGKLETATETREERVSTSFRLFPHSTYIDIACGNNHWQDKSPVSCWSRQTSCLVYIARDWHNTHTQYPPHKSGSQSIDDMYLHQKIQDGSVVFSPPISLSTL